MSDSESSVHSSPAKRKGWIGLDIGGANIKLAWLDGTSNGNQSGGSGLLIESFPFPLWKSSNELPAFLIHLLSRFPNTFAIAVTMTGELADCYSNREVGVCEIVQGVEFAIGRLNVIRGGEGGDRQSSESRRLLQAFYYGISDGSDRIPKHQWLNAAQARQYWSQVAAANWHAIATYASRFLVLDDRRSDFDNQAGFLVDIGSTTTDIIPIKSGAPCAIGKDDFSRLKSGELFYAGVGRTPICSFVDELIVEGHSVTVAREFFATIDDVLIVLGLVTENPGHCETADGRPATKKHSRQRLARMLCNDSSELKTRKSSSPLVDTVGFPGCAADFDNRVLESIAQQVLDRLEARILQSIRQVVSSNPALPRNFIVSGQGAWLAEKLLVNQGYQVRLLAQSSGEPASRSAAAAAVAHLAFEDLANKLPKSSHQSNLLNASPEALSTKELTKELTKESLGIRVVKLGGSLIDSRTTPERLQRWIEKQEPMLTLWIAGGGKLVETVREFDKCFALEEKAAHWLCLDLMTINQRLIQHWFPDWPIRNCFESSASTFVHSKADLNQLVDFSGWSRNQQKWTAIISNQSSAAASKARCHEPLAESWDVTSDSCAAYFAQSIGANELVLLKSCEIPSSELEHLADLKITDCLFPKYASGIPSVRVIQLVSQT